MKFVTLVAIASVMLGHWCWAQNVDVKGVEAQEGSTTIEIRKNVPSQGNPSGTQKCQPNWEIVEGTADVEGEMATMQKEAKGLWKKACAEWKKEFRADNKDNKVILADCGVSSCTGESGGKTCVSKAKYKIKTKLD